jgi:hypothetical protein
MTLRLHHANPSGSSLEGACLLLAHSGFAEPLLLRQLLAAKRTLEAGVIAAANDPKRTPREPSKTAAFRTMSVPISARCNAISIEFGSV